MSRRSHTRPAPPRRWLAALGAWLGRSARSLWRWLRRWRQRIPVEVLVADGARRRGLECELRAGLARLQRVLGAPPTDDLAVVVQQVIRTDRQLAGCYQSGQRLDGTRFALVRLALQVNGRRLSTDELLAALAEQCIGLATERAGAPSVVVPVELETAQGDQAPRPASLRPDPLAPPDERAA